MSVATLISGVIVFGDPQRKMSREMKPFVSLKMRVANGRESNTWTVWVWSESAQAEALRLKEGDHLAAQGAPRFELYQPEGRAPRLNLTLTADLILAARQPPRERKAKASASTASPPQHDRTRTERVRGVADPDLNDEIPF